MSFSDFFQQNIVMFLATFGLFIYLIILEIKSAGSQATTITTTKLSLVSNDGGTIIDLRKAEDYKKGHIPGAKNIPLSDIEEKLSSVGKKEKPVVLYCYKGKGSATALTMLNKKGFTNAMHLAGGFASWSGENMPTVKS